MPAGTGAGAPASEASSLVLEHVAVVDVVRGRTLPDRTVVVQGGRIVSVDSTRAERAGALDLTGRWLLPGLIDTHVHVATDPAGFDRDAQSALEWAFRSGVTSVRDMAGDTRALVELARAAADSTVAAPTLVYSALVAGPTFFDDPRPQASARGAVAGQVDWMQAVTPDSDLTEVMARARATGATGLKIYADLPAAELGPLVDAAHAAGLQVWSHAVTYPGRPSDVVRAGPDVVSHAYYLVWELAETVPFGYAAGRAALGAPDAAGPPPTDAPALDAVFDAMAARGIVLEPTLTVVNGDSPFAWLRGWASAVTARAHARGVTIVAGTDRMVDRDTRRSNLPDELLYLVRDAGFTPAEALRAATVDAARALGREGQVGRIAPGFRADLVVLDADPLEDVAAVRAVHRVIKAGHVHEVR